MMIEVLVVLAAIGQLRAQDANWWIQNQVNRGAAARAAQRKWELENPTPDQKATRQRMQDVFEDNAREWKSRDGKPLGRGILVDRTKNLVRVAWYVEKEDKWRVHAIGRGQLCEADKRFVQAEVARQAKEKKGKPAAKGR